MTIVLTPKRLVWIVFALLVFICLMAAGYIAVFFSDAVKGGILASIIVEIASCVVGGSAGFAINIAFAAKSAGL